MIQIIFVYIVLLGLDGWLTWAAKKQWIEYFFTICTTFMGVTGYCYYLYDGFLPGDVIETTRTILTMVFVLIFTMIGLTETYYYVIMLKRSDRVMVMHHVSSVLFMLYALYLGTYDRLIISITVVELATVFVHAYHVSKNLHPVIATTVKIISTLVYFVRFYQLAIIFSRVTYATALTSLFPFSVFGNIILGCNIYWCATIIVSMIGPIKKAVE